MLPATTREPRTSEEWRAYYNLRWQVLRAPWQQPRGSEKDELDDEALHHMIIDNQQVIAVGRVHFIDAHTAQIRYMAVAPEYEKRGYGKQLLLSLEKSVKENNIHEIILHARESVTGFYEKQGYIIIKPSHTLFKKIKHYLMVKKI